MDAAAFGANAGTVVLVGGGYARVWSAQDGTPVTPPLQDAPRSSVTYAAAGSDGRFLAPAASDGSASLRANGGSNQP